jgi:glycosyltransferase involved in cell wall biosynthesis
MKRQKLNNTKILIVHFRVGKTDGVSLEIDSWKAILESAGAQVALCSGPVNHGADYVIPDLEQQLNKNIFAIDENAFGGLKTFNSNKKLKSEILKYQNTISQHFAKVLSDFAPNHIFISNIFSVGEGFPVPGGLLKVLDKQKIPTTLINHDFYWENKRYDIPTSQFIEKQLKKSFLPKRSYINHLCINSIGKNALNKRRNIKAALLYDTFDFDQPNLSKKDCTTDFLSDKGISPNDLVLLQATRVVRRKNIELSIDLASQLSKSSNIKKLADKTLYNSRNFSPEKDQIKLVLSGYVEKRHRGYLEELMSYAEQKKVSLIYLGKDLHRKYELFDIYPYADIITYPSEYEGFGNQLLEAFFARKPVALFEYPVFQTDIKPLNFQYISLGDEKQYDNETGLAKVPSEIMQKATDQTIQILSNPILYKNWTEKNYETARKNFSLQNVKRVLINCIT